MRVPGQVLTQVTSIVHASAARLDWPRLKNTEKSQWYENWIADPMIGGVLLRYMKPDQVRVYLKDTVVRRVRVSNDAHSDVSQIALAAGLPAGTEAIKSYIKPNGRLFASGPTLVCWAPAANWRHVLMACYERSRGSNLVQTKAVLTAAVGKFDSPVTRAMVEDAAERLSVSSVTWLP